MTTEIEQKALALVNDCGGDVLVVVRNGNAWVEALCRAIERHEAFRQEVSDVVWDYYGGKHIPRTSMFAKFIIPKPKPDPLVDVLLGMELSSDLQEGQHDAIEIRKALDAAGFEIREKNDD